ncbi:MAG: phosphodiester glycosidase family protein, partial [Polyangiaceae bacterium]
SAHLTATEDYVPHAPDFAVQCRPRLVVGSHRNIKTDDGKRAARTALCLRDGGRTIDIVVALGAGVDAGPTLFELANELESTGCEEALNLDGGPSTGWASRLEDASVFVPPRGPVRQVIAVVAAN